MLTQRFRENTTGVPDFYSRYGLPGHEAWDYAGNQRAPIYAADDGVVKAINVPGIGGVAPDHPYGIHIKLLHRDGAFETDYCHLHSTLAALSVGDRVRKHQLIARMGRSGNVVGSGYHLHFMLRKRGATASGETDYPNDIVDPALYMPPVS